VKLHKIHIENLNSLYGKHDLNLEEMLGETALFLIRGETASGKSTIMDAVSLCLFGVTPRLTGKSVKNRKKPRPVTIMSRGTKFCLATIEFSILLGSVRTRYQATWKVERSRGSKVNPAGKYKSAVREIRELVSDQWELIVSSEKEKVYSPHFKRILGGFTVEDFQRSMLLAQGEFNKFLMANPEERSTILERLTDTSLYKNIGSRAYRIRQAYEKKIKDHERDLEKLKAPDQKEIDDLKLAAETTRTAIITAEKSVQQLSTKKGWIQSELVMLAARQKVSDDLMQQLEKEKDFSAEKERLLEHRRCEKEGAFKLHETSEERLASLRRTVQKRKKVAQQTPACRVEVERSTTVHLYEKKLLDVLRSGRNGIRPLSQTAREHRLAEEKAGRDVQREVLKREKSTERLLVETKKLEGLQSQIAEKSRVLEKASKEMDSYARLEPLCEDWPQIQSGFDKLKERQRAIGEAKSKVLERDKSLSDQIEGLEEEKLVLESRSRSELPPLQEKQEEIETRLLRLLGLDEAPSKWRLAIDDQLTLLHGRQTKAEKAMDSISRAFELLNELETSTKERQNVQEEQKDLQESRMDLVRKRKHLDEILKEREFGLQQQIASDERLRELHDLIPRRILLVDGEECPLCGALHHPFVDDPSNRKIDAEIEADVLASKTGLEAAKGRVAEAAEKIENLKITNNAVEKDLATAGVRLLEAQKSQSKVRKQLDIVLVGIGLSESADADILHVKENQVRAEHLLSKENEASLRAYKEEMASHREKMKKLSDELVGIENAIAKRLFAQKEMKQTVAGDIVLLHSRDEKLKEEVGMFRAGLLALEVECTGGLLEWEARAEKLYRSQISRRSELESAAKVVDSLTADLGGQEKAVAVLLENVAIETQSLADQKEKRKERKTSFETAEGEVLAFLNEMKSRMVSMDKVSGDSEVQHIFLLDSSMDSVEDLALEAFEQCHDRIEERMKLAQKDLLECEATLKENLDSSKMLSEMESEASSQCLETETALGNILAILGIGDVEELVARKLDNVTLERFDTSDEQLVLSRHGLETRKAAVEERLDAHQKLRPGGLDAQGSGLSDKDWSLYSVQEKEEIIVRNNKRSEEIMVKIQEDKEILETVTDRQKEHGRIESQSVRLREELTQLESVAYPWLELSKLIGTNDGGSFRVFAQALNLKRLLDKANKHLVRFSKRYVLINLLNDGIPTLEFAVQDTEQGNEIRSVDSLSGGETFLVSLSLALGLSDFRSVKMRIETLLLDEGFGTLDKKVLDQAIGALTQLQTDGRQVGIISHVEGLVDRIPAQILVQKLGGGRSRIAPDPGKTA
jgi:DNA repair protein SbcC/Rad50